MNFTDCMWILGRNPSRTPRGDGAPAANGNSRRLDPRASAGAEHVPPATQAKIERAKQEWEATVDALPDLVCLLDPSGLIIRANRTVESWNLGDVKHVAGLRLHDLLHQRCTELECALNA